MSPDSIDRQHTSLIPWIHEERAMGAWISLRHGDAAVICVARDAAFDRWNCLERQAPLSTRFWSRKRMMNLRMWSMRLRSCLVAFLVDQNEHWANRNRSRHSSKHNVFSEPKQKSFISPHQRIRLLMYFTWHSLREDVFPLHVTAMSSATPFHTHLLRLI